MSSLGFEKKHTTETFFDARKIMKMEIVYLNAYWRLDCYCNILNFSLSLRHTRFCFDSVRWRCVFTLNHSSTIDDYISHIMLAIRCQSSRNPNRIVAMKWVRSFSLCNISIWDCIIKQRGTYKRRQSMRMWKKKRKSAKNDAPVSN